MTREIVRAVGHRHVSGTHESTLELTTDDWLTPAGDCILGIEANRAPATFDDAFVDQCRSADARLMLTLRSGESTDRIRGRGDPRLTFDSDRSLVARTSRYVDARTVLIDADKAAVDVDRDLVAALQRGERLTATLTVDPADD